jgi:DNA-binding CsgD family transcriptional regulator/tetratricopeptide (TPR) repeat protein
MGMSGEMLFERSAEVKALRAALARCARGRGGFVLIRAAAGTGKTALLAEAIVSARRRHFRILRARAARPEAASATGVTAQLREAAGHGSGQGGLQALLGELADAGPVALAIDDAHWCEDEGLRELLGAAPRIEALPVVVLLAARLAEPGSSDLLATLAGEPNAETIAPGPLSDVGVTEVLDDALGAAPQPGFSRAVGEWTGGNPALTRELAKALVAEEVEPTAGAVERMRAIVPAAVANDLELRLARFCPAERAMAAALALLGDAAELGLATRLAGLPENEGRDAADRLIAAEILRPGPPPAFAQPIVGAAAYASIPPARRRGEHRRAAVLLAGWGAPPEAVVSHLLRSDPAADSGAVELLREAAARELARGAPREAAELLRRALAEPPPRSERLATLLESAAAEDLASRGDFGEERLREALVLGPDASERARVANTLSLLLTRRGQLEVACDTARRELELARGAGADERSLLELEVQLCLSLQLGAAGSGREVDERLERLAPRLMEGATAVERTGLATLAFRRMARAEPAAEAIAPALRALEAGMLGDPGAESGPAGMAIGVLVHCEAVPEAELWIERTLVRSRERGADFGLGVGSFIAALLAFRRGDLAKARESAEASAAATSDHDSPWVDSILLAAATDIRLAGGEDDVAAAALADRGLDRELPPLATFSTLLESRGRLRLRRGEADAGRADLRAAGERFAESGIACPGYTSWRSSLALATDAVGEPGRAGELVAEELALAHRFGVPRPLGIVQRAQGLITSGDEGIELLREAAATLAASGAELEHAGALVELGAALRRSGRRGDARGPLRAGFELAERCGALPLASRAGDELRASGARPRPTTDGGTSALTPSEARICNLAAAGNSNPAIARQLFVTRATVESHLHSSYRKLGIASRKGLAAALAEVQ